MRAHPQPRLLQDSPDPIADALRLLDVLDRLETGDRTAAVREGAAELADLLTRLGDDLTVHEIRHHQRRHCKRR